MTRALLLAMVVLLAGCTSAPPAQTPPPSTTEQQPQRPPVEELQSGWWTWASQPGATNPVADTSGKFCMRNQPRDVWFVAGTFGGVVERQCRIPSDKPVFGPAITLRSGDCAAFMKSAKGEVLLDGIAQELIRVDGAKTTECGLWAYLPELTAGEHTLVLKGSSGEFSAEARYVLIVGADAR